MGPAPNPVPSPSHHPRDSSFPSAWGTGSCLSGDHLGHHVSGVHINGADGHDFHSVAGAEISNEQSDECVQLADLQREMGACAGAELSGLDAQAVGVHRE